jgi:hypothetical protein
MIGGTVDEYLEDMKKKSLKCGHLSGLEKGARNGSFAPSLTRRLSTKPSLKTYPKLLRGL